MRYLDLMMTTWRMAVVGSAIMSGGLVSDVANADESFRVSSEIKGITVTPVNVLPKAPAREKMTACEDMAIKPKTTAGQLVAAKGWVVTGEVKIGNYTAVSFGGKLASAYDHTCMVTKGS